MRALLIVLLLTAIALPEGDFQSQYDEARVLLEVGSYRAALESLEEADRLYARTAQPPLRPEEWGRLLAYLRLCARRELGEPVLEEALRMESGGGLPYTLLVILEARRLGRVDLLASRLGPAMEMARRDAGEMGPVARFLLETIQLERDWQAARRLTVSDFVDRNDRAFAELKQVKPGALNPFAAFWLTEVMIAWAEGRAALEAEYGPLPELAEAGQRDDAILAPLLADWYPFICGYIDLIVQLQEAYHGTPGGSNLDERIRAMEPTFRNAEEPYRQLARKFPGKVRGRVPQVFGHYYQTLARLEPARAPALLAKARPWLELSDSRAALDSLTMDELELQVAPNLEWMPSDPVLKARKLLLDGKAAMALDLSEDLVRLGAGTLGSRRQALAVARRSAAALAEAQLARGEADAAYQTRARIAQLESWVRLDLDRVRSTDASQQKALEELAEARISGDRQSYYKALDKLQRSQPTLRLLIIRPSSFAALQSKIPADMAVVQYFPAADKLYIFVATKERLQVREVKVSQAELASQVHALRRSLVSPDQTPALEPLRQELVGSLEADLAGRKLIAFIPSGVLMYVPFSVLEERPSTTLVKATDLNALLTPPERIPLTLVALGDPDGSLPGARREVEALARIIPSSQTFVGPQAAVTHLPGGASLLHLATHGVLNCEDPLSSYLLVAPDATCPDGRLRVSDVAGMQLGGVSLVTLSACETALAERDPAPGQELATLADAFNYAGSPSLVASLWKVPDASTALLMEELYRGLAAGKNRAEALRAAQSLVSHRPEYAHPFYWAGFVLLGDWR